MSKTIARHEHLAIAASPGSPDSPGSGGSVGSSGSFGTTTIMTSKEWILPPRPKPGRKPSADTPALKRKAQNRAAQRAFRERRATRVQELELKLLEVEKEREIKELGFINTILKLRSENLFLLKNVEKLRRDVYEMRAATGGVGAKHGHRASLTVLSAAASAAPSPNAVQNLPSFYQSTAAGQAGPAGSNPPVGHRTSASAGSAASPAGSTLQQVSPAPLAHSPQGNSPSSLAGSNDTAGGAVVSEAAAVEHVDCGVCDKDECFCEEVGLKPKRALDLDKFEPTAAVSLKRHKPELETDFTKSFKTKPMPDMSRLGSRAKRSNNEFMETGEGSAPAQFEEGSPVDDCGFCSDDTPCVCREAAKEAASINSKLHTLLPPILNTGGTRATSLPVMHPGPLVEIRDVANLSPGSIPTVVGPSSPNRSTGRGSMAGALEELADAAEEASTPLQVTTSDRSATDKPSGCTGNPGTCSQCQMDPMSTLFCTTVANIKEEMNETAESRQKQQTAPHGMFIPCSDAYKTLSRHKEFGSVDFSTLVGKLTTRGMQVEVQSVANVLRELDRRLYN